MRFGQKFPPFFSSSPLSKFVLLQEKAERFPNYLSLNQNYHSIEFIVTLQLPLGIKNSHKRSSLSSYSLTNACAMPAGSGVRAPTTLKLWSCAQPHSLLSAAFSMPMAAAVCSQGQTRPEHPEVSSSEKSRCWEFVLQLFRLTFSPCICHGLQNVLCAWSCVCSYTSNSAQELTLLCSENPPS